MHVSSKHPFLRENSVPPLRGQFHHNQRDCSSFGVNNLTDRFSSLITFTTRATAANSTGASPRIKAVLRARSLKTSSSLGESRSQETDSSLILREPSSRTRTTMTLSSSSVFTVGGSAGWGNFV